MILVSAHVMSDHSSAIKCKTSINEYGIPCYIFNAHIFHVCMHEISQNYRGLQQRLAQTINIICKIFNHMVIAVCIEHRKTATVEDVQMRRQGIRDQTESAHAPLILVVSARQPEPESRLKVIATVTLAQPVPACQYKTVAGKRYGLTPVHTQMQSVCLSSIIFCGTVSSN